MTGSSPPAALPSSDAVSGSAIGLTSTTNTSGTSSQARASRDTVRRHNVRPSTQPYLPAYSCRSKLANVLFTAELQRRLDEAGIPILVMSVDPGLVRTGTSTPSYILPTRLLLPAPNDRYHRLADGVQNDAASQPPGISHLMSLLVRTLWTPPTRGAFASVFAAASPTVRIHADGYRGAYLQPPGRKGMPPHPAARSVLLARELWDTTERLLDEVGVQVDRGDKLLSS